jgi:hypothetical protein
VPASIFGDRFMGRREPAWHGLGTVFPADAKVIPAEALLRIGGDTWIQKLPLTVKLPDGTVHDTDRVAIVRYPTHDDGQYRIMGYAGVDYEVVQNIELAFMVEQLAEEWPLETIGLLGHGEVVFITLDAGSAEVGGEEVRQFFMVSNAHTGGRSLKIALTPVRVVCQNTLIAATSAASIISTLPHTVNVRAEANFRIDLIANMRKKQADLMRDFRRMAQARVVDDQVDEILRAAYPDPKLTARKLLGDTVVRGGTSALGDDRQFAVAALTNFRQAEVEHEARVKRVEVLRTGARERYNVVCDESPRVARTPWAVWQGVTEVENYRRGSKDGERVAEAVLFGERAATMARTYTKAVEVTNSVLPN